MRTMEAFICLVFLTVLFLVLKKEKKVSAISFKIITPIKYKPFQELEKIVFPALKYVETQDRPIDITSDKFERGSYGPCQIREIAFRDANQRLSNEFKFKKIPLQTEKEYIRFVITYAGVLLRDYVGIIPLEAKLRDIKHIILAWVNPAYYSSYLKGLRPPLPDYKRRIQRLNRFLAREGYRLRFSTESPFYPFYEE